MELKTWMTNVARSIREGKHCTVIEPFLSFLFERQDGRNETTKSARHSRLAPLNLLASCSLSDFGDWGLIEGGNGRGGDRGRLGGRSPLS